MKKCDAFVFVAAPVEFPPLSLLSVVTEWVHSQPMLPYSFPSTVNKSSPPLLYPNPNRSSACSSAVIGLVAWTVLGPLVSDLSNELMSARKKKELRQSVLCSRLHSSLLRGAVEFQQRAAKSDHVECCEYARHHTTQMVKIVERIAAAVASSKGTNVLIHVRLYRGPVNRAAISALVCTVTVSLQDQTGQPPRQAHDTGIASSCFICIDCAITDSWCDITPYNVLRHILHQTSVD